MFVTIWVIGQSQLMDYLPALIKQSNDMRVPHTGEEYQRLSFDVCTTCVFAVAFYYSLMYAIARDSRIMTSSLENFEQTCCSEGTGGTPEITHNHESMSKASAQ